MQDETVNINVLIAERLYPLKVKKSDEERVRNAVKLVTERIKEYQELYAGKDKQDYIAMCLLNVAVEYLGVQHDKQQGIRLLENEVAEIEALLQSAS